MGSLCYYSKINTFPAHSSMLWDASISLMHSLISQYNDSWILLSNADSHTSTLELKGTWIKTSDDSLILVLWRVFNTFSRPYYSQGTLHYVRVEGKLITWVLSCTVSPRSELIAVAIFCGIVLLQSTSRSSSDECITLERCMMPSESLMFAASNGFRDRPSSLDMLNEPLSSRALCFHWEALLRNKFFLGAAVSGATWMRLTSVTLENKHLKTQHQDINIRYLRLRSNYTVLTTNLMYGLRESRLCGLLRIANSTVSVTKQNLGNA